MSDPERGLHVFSVVGSGFSSDFFESHKYLRNRVLFFLNNNEE